jgi:hypothetical protein
MRNLSRAAVLGAAFFLASAGFAADEAGFTPLFDGKSLEGWVTTEMRGRGYFVEDGILVCPADGGGNIYTEKEYANFILRFEFRMEPDGNSGIGIRAPLGGSVSSRGMEIQILDLGPKYSKATLRPEQLHGSLYGMIPARQGFLRKPWEWNDMEIKADGRRLMVTVNGAIVLDNDMDIVREIEVLKKHPGVKRASGHIALLGHRTRVDFRNIRIKELP